jgi:hypothetical protein
MLSFSNYSSEDENSSFISKKHDDSKKAEDNKEEKPDIVITIKLEEEGLLSTPPIEPIKTKYGTFEKEDLKEEKFIEEKREIPKLVAQYFFSH